MLHRWVERATAFAVRSVATRGLELELDERGDDAPSVVLVVGSDARGSLTRSLRRLRADVADRRADALGILVARPGDATTLVRIPRDAFVDVPGVGPQRIGWALSYGGPQRLVDSVRSEFGIPVHHYVEIGFVAFARIVAAHGGLPTSLANGRIDRTTGLRRRRFFRLSGRDALALARSRSPDAERALTDAERMQTQDGILEALAERRSRSRLVLTLLGLLPRFGRDVLTDNSWDDGDRRWLSACARSTAFDTVTMPLSSQFDEGGASSPFVDFVSSRPVLGVSSIDCERLRHLVGAGTSGLS